jgi:hypothetical protein
MIDTASAVRYDDILYVPAPPERGRTDGKRTRSPEPTPEARAALAAAQTRTRMLLRLQYSGAADAWCIEGRYRSLPSTLYVLRTDGRLVLLHGTRAAVR